MLLSIVAPLASGLVVGAAARGRATVARAAPARMGGCEGSSDDGAFWLTLDGRGEEGVSPDGVFPPGDDLVEKDLKRLFSIDDDEVGATGESGMSDADEVQLMWKLRKELGDDFNRIFDGPKIRGSDIFGSN